MADNNDPTGFGTEPRDGQDSAPRPPRTSAPAHQTEAAQQPSQVLNPQQLNPHRLTTPQSGTPQQPVAPQPVLPQSVLPQPSLPAPQQPAATGYSPYAPAGHTPAAPYAAPQGYPAQSQQAQPYPDMQQQATQPYPQYAAPQVPQAAPSDQFGDASNQETADLSGTAFQAAAEAPTKDKRGFSAGAFVAGVAVAALLGGAVGGGVISSIVVANSEAKSSTVVQQGGTLTLNNAETATAISGVALVATPSVVTLNVQTSNGGGSGSGVIYSEDGYIITNAHVVTIDGAASDPRIRVQLSDGRVYDGEIVGVAPYADIAVVKINAENLTPIQVADSSNVNVGDLAVAIGAPMSLANTVTSGVVSALNRGISVGSPLIPQDPSQTPDEGNGGRFPWDFRFDTPDQGDGTEEEEAPQAVGQVTLPVIQTDASINPGNSGGALLNGQGHLIGINVAIASPGASQGSASSAGLGFAIPSSLATRVADEIIAGDQPSHGLLGAGVVDSSADTDADANHAGGLLREVVPGGAAAKGGLKVGDVITAIDGVPAADGTSVSALIRMHSGGSEINIDYTRNGKPDQTTVTLGTLDW